jgi:hypothetical protein
LSGMSLVRILRQPDEPNDGPSDEPLYLVRVETRHFHHMQTSISLHILLARQSGRFGCEHPLSR